MSGRSSTRAQGLRLAAAETALMSPAAAPSAPAQTSGLLLGSRTEPRRLGLAHRGMAETTAGELVWHDDDRHLATFAPTGSGKSRGAAIPALLTYPGPAVVIDPKGELFHVTAGYRRKLGQKVLRLDPFEEAGPGGDSLNPLDIFDLPGPDKEADAEMVAAMLSSGHEFASDRYWNDTGTGLLSGMLAHLATAAAPADRHLGEVRRLLHDGDLDMTLANLLDQGPSEIPSRLAREEFSAYLAAPGDKTRPCILTTTLTYLKCLGSECVLRALQSSTVSLADIHAGAPVTVYLTIPPDRLDSHRALLRVWVGTLMTAVFRRKRLPPHPTLFLLDECASLGALPQLRQAVTLMRGYGLKVWMLYQDLSQLKLLYPQDWPTLLNNCGSLQVFGLAHPHMAREWADLLGMEPGEVAKLRPEEAWVCQAGREVIRLRRPDYLCDPMFAGRFAPNPRHAAWPEDRPALAVR